MQKHETIIINHRWPWLFTNTWQVGEVKNEVNSNGQEQEDQRKRPKEQEQTKERQRKERTGIITAQPGSIKADALILPGFLSVLIHGRFG